MGSGTCWKGAHLMYQFQFDSVAAFVAMGGHGPYIWAAYGVGLFAMTWLVVRPLHQKKRFVAQFPRSKGQTEESSVATTGKEDS